MTPLEFAAAVAKHGSINAACKATGIRRTTAQNLFKKAGGKPRAGIRATTALEFPEVPSRKEPIGSLISRRVDHFNRQKTHADAAKWQQVKVSDNKPFALAFIGDPHIDDDGCNMPALLDDIAYLKRTPGLFAVNIGDTTNNWVGRLARLFGNQETSQTSARQLAEWFLTGAGINWAAVILGNHDEWNEGGEIIKRMCGAAPVRIPVHEWVAKIEFAFPNGAKFRVNAAHDFKGRSIYNATHGLKREAIWHQDGSHVLAAGHIHYGEIGQCELPGGHNPWLVRVRGYKDFDPHAIVNGYHEGTRFRSVVAIFDPSAPEGERVTVYPSIRQGAHVLAAMRGDKIATLDAKAKRVAKSATKKKAKRK